MIVDKIWKLTNVVRLGLAPRSSHSQRQATFTSEQQGLFLGWGTTAGGLSDAQHGMLNEYMEKFDQNNSIQ